MPIFCKIIEVFKDRNGCLSSKRIGFLLLALTIPPVLLWVIDYLMILGKPDNITDLVKTLIWATATLGGAVASESFRK